MTVSISGTITGTAQTGFTTPGYTVTQDNAVDGNVKRWVVTALTGTQTGVRAHSVSDEFSFTVVKPKVMKVIQAFSSLLPNNFRPAYNRYWLIFRKGGIPASGLVSIPQTLRVPIDVAAGVDNYDIAQIRAMVSFAGGVLTSISAGLGDTLANGIL
jgi:hypothetical protein